MIRTRQEACSALGLAPTATQAQIKNAYKDLVKKCHPDVTGSDDATVYNRIVEAYQFLCANGATSYSAPTTKVVGKTTKRHTASNAEYAAFQKKAARQKEQKKKEFEEKQKEFSAKIEKQEADYKRAMEAIDAVIAARALEAMIRANSIKDEADSNKKD